MVRGGEVGEIDAIRVTYLQGGLRQRKPDPLDRRIRWRTDPQRSGAAGCFADIGTHAYNLGRFITGLLPDQVSCLLRTFDPGHEVYDYGVASIRFENGALGTMIVSQVSHGKENDLWIEIDGTRGALEWRQEDPNKLVMRVNGQPQRHYSRNIRAAYMTPSAKASCRLPGGHPEGFFEAFANIYNAVYDDMSKRASGQTIDSTESLYPNVADGVDGMNFITQCVASSEQNGHWLPLKHPLGRA